MIYNSVPQQWILRFEQLAERRPHTLAELARRAVGVNAKEPLCHYMLGWALLQCEDFDAARACLRIAQRSSDNLVLLRRCRYALLAVDVLQRPSRAVVTALDDIAEECTQAMVAAETSRARRSAAQVLFILGFPEEALGRLDAIHPDFNHDGPLDRLRWLRLRAASLILLGQTDKASPLLEAAMSIALQHHALPDYGRCVHLGAWAALRDERLDDAIAGYLDAYHTYHRLGLAFQMAHALKGAGLALVHRGSYQHALTMLLEATQQYRALGQRSEETHCRSALGQIAYTTARWHLATQLHEATATRYQELGMEWYARGARRNQAAVARELGHLDQARDWLLTLLPAATASGDMAEVAQITSQLAGIQADLGDRIGAIETYNAAATLFVQLGNQPDAAECWMEQGWIFLHDSNSNAAEKMFARIGQALDRHPHHHWRVAYGLARCVLAQGNTRAALDQYTLALTIVSTMRRRLASEIVSSTLAQRTSALTDEALRHAVRCGDGERVLLLDELRRAIVFQRLITDPQIVLRDHNIDTLLAPFTYPGDVELPVITGGLHQINAGVHKHNMMSSVELFPPAFALNDLRCSLEEQHGVGWTIISFIEIGDTLIRTVVTNLEVVVDTLAIDIPLLRLLRQVGLESYRRYIYHDVPFIAGKTARRWEVLTLLADYLIAPMVRERLHPNHRLLIVPSGVLHTLPWASLRLDGHWLIEQAVITITPSLSVLETLQKRSSTSKRTLLVGCGVFGGRADELPGVVGEIAMLAELYESAETLQDEEATCMKLATRLAAPESYNIIHIASHARLRREEGVHAHLKLFDGDLGLQDITSLNLRGALVVMSTCDGTAIDALPGDEALSLSWALMAAGARGVVGSLWPIYDYPALALMQRFHTLLQSTHDPSLALALAQRERATHFDISGDDAATPDQWAGFTVI